LTESLHIIRVYRDAATSGDAYAIVDGFSNYTRNSNTYSSSNSLVAEDARGRYAG
jgi:hypothetical protein